MRLFFRTLFLSATETTMFLLRKGVFGGLPTGPAMPEWAVEVMLHRERGCFSFLEPFSGFFGQTGPMLPLFRPLSAVLRRSYYYVGARFGAKLTRLWQNTAIPTDAAKLLNPRYMQIESRKARFKTEIDPSIPARK